MAHIGAAKWSRPLHRARRRIHLRPGMGEGRRRCLSSSRMSWPRRRCRTEHIARHRHAGADPDRCGRTGLTTKGVRGTEEAVGGRPGCRPVQDIPAGTRVNCIDPAPTRYGRAGRRSRPEPARRTAARGYGTRVTDSTATVSAGCERSKDDRPTECRPDTWPTSAPRCRPRPVVRCARTRLSGRRLLPAGADCARASAMLHETRIDITAAIAQTLTKTSSRNAAHVSFWPSSRRPSSIVHGPIIHRQLLEHVFGVLPQARRRSGLASSRK